MSTVSQSAPQGTKIFGITPRVDPKIILGALAVIFAFAMWWNLRSADETPATSSTAAPAVAAPTPVPFTKNKGRSARRNALAADRGVLRIKAVDATDGRIDPTLRTDLLSKLHSVQLAPGGRSLFEVGPSPEAIAAAQAPIRGPKIPVNAPVVQPTVAQNFHPAAPTVNIPLRYYGFVNPMNKQETNRGLFMDGDNILVAKEGEQLEGRYLVVALNASNARMEDTQLRQGQILPVTPEAPEQQ